MPASRPAGYLKKRKSSRRCRALAQRGASKKGIFKKMYLARPARCIKKENFQEDVGRSPSAVHQKRESSRRCTSLAQRGASKKKTFKKMYLARTTGYMKKENLQEDVPRSPGAVHQKRNLPRRCTSLARRGASKEEIFKKM
ncbi:MAG: hypothetical protein ACQEUT_03025 [Bacillota bacterium]